MICHFEKKAQSAVSVLLIPALAQLTVSEMANGDEKALSLQMVPFRFPCAVFQEGVRTSSLCHPPWVLSILKRVCHSDYCVPLDTGAMPRNVLISVAHACRHTIVYIAPPHLLLSGEHRMAHCDCH